MNRGSMGPFTGRDVLKPQVVARDPRTVLVVADDSDMLGFLHQILQGRGNRALLASGATSAARLLKLELGIDCAMIRAGLTNSERIERMCLRRGVDVLFLSGIVEGGIIRLRVPERRLQHRLVS